MAVRDREIQLCCPKPSSFWWQGFHFVTSSRACSSDSMQETCPNYSLCPREKTGLPLLPPVTGGWESHWPEVSSFPSGHTPHFCGSIMRKLWWNAGGLLQGMFGRSTAHTQLALAQYASPLKMPFPMYPDPIFISQWWSINPYVTWLQTKRINNWKRKAVERWLGRQALRGKWGQAFREKKVIDYEKRQIGGITFPRWVG